MTSRELVLRLHRWVGLSIGIVIWMLCVTGAILLVAMPADSDALHRSGRVTPGPGTPRSASELLEAAARELPERQVQSIELQRDPTRAAVILFRGGSAALLDPWTGAVVDVREGGAASAVVTRLHTSLALGGAGRAIVIIGTAAFLLLVFLGLWLWWPARGARGRAFRIETRKGWKRLNHDAHSALGFYAAVLLVALAGSGVLLSFPRLMEVAGRAAAVVLPEPPTPAATPAGGGAPADADVASEAPLVDRALDHAVRLYPDAPWRRAVAVPGTPPRYRVLVAVDERVDRAHTLRVNPGGELVGVVEYGSERTPQRVARFVNQLHTGRFDGPWPVVAFVACVIGATLPLTGALIWFPRWRRKSARAA